LREIRMNLWSTEKAGLPRSPELLLTNSEKIRSRQQRTLFFLASGGLNWQETAC
jgi:hypothetical protein